MSKIKAEVSAGELLDKISILEIKMERIQDKTKRRNVMTELNCLTSVRDSELRDWNLIDDVYLQLKDVNEKLWDVEDKLRKFEQQQEFDQEFIQLARMVYFENDKRARLKRTINEKLGSEIVEEKNYVNYSQPEL